MIGTEPPAQESRPGTSIRLTSAALATLAVILIGLADFFTGPDLAFALFYLIPVSAIAWQTGSRGLGVAIALLSAGVWVVAEILMPGPMLHPFLIAWNGLTRLAIFVSIALLLSAFRASLEHERSLARTDFLTGVLNARAFIELAQTEIYRSRRYAHPLTVAYIDLDNFKIVNDQRGHSQGDELLRTVAATLQTRLRKSDSVARMGGDEFALLLPETGQAAAEPVVEKVQAALATTMQERRWPVTASIGVVTFEMAPTTVDEIIRAADHLMYLAKSEGKNCVRYLHLRERDAA
ncbi:hypothetical protein BH24PSE2_BH24PSE2_07900 [soil metagenome]